MPVVAITATGVAGYDLAYIAPGASWSAVRDAASGSLADDETWLGAHATKSGSNYSCYRKLICFDTSAIPVGAYIRSVKLKAYLIGFNGTGQYMDLVTTDLTSAGFVNTSDYAISHFGTTALAQWPKTGTANQPYEQTVTGLTIVCGGTTVVGCIAEQDRADSAPSGDNWTHWHGPGASASYRPVLTIDYTPPDDLDGSHRIRGVDDLDGSHRILFAWIDEDLPGSHRVRSWHTEDLDGSHRVLVWIDDDLHGSHMIWSAGLPAAAPRVLHVPRLSLLVGDTERIDLIAEGADATTVRFGNAVTGGHGGASGEIPRRPGRRAVNGLVRGTPARLYDGADLLYQGVVKKVSGSDGGDGRSVTRVEFCGPMDLADLDESFAWTWVDADYGLWQEVTLPTGPFETSKGQSGTYAEYAPRDASWEVRSDGELFIGTVAGSTYYGDPFYVRKPCLKRLAYCLDRRTLGEWPSGNALRMGDIMAIEFDWRVDVGQYFRAEVGTAHYPAAPSDLIAVSWSKTDTVDRGHGTQVDLRDGPCVFLQLSHYAQTDHVGAGEFVQLLHVRVAVRPDGPAGRSWAFGDAFPTLQDCFCDVLTLGGATTVEAEEISAALTHAKVDGPTLTDACQALADADEDEDGTGQPIEYGIWNEGRGVVRRRPEEPDDLSQWLAIDTERDDVTVEVAYEEALAAPDVVEVRYAYLKTNLIRHHSPAEAGYWIERGQSDDRPYDWSFGGSGTYEHDVVTVEGQRRYAMRIGPGTSDSAHAIFPAGGQYPVAPVGGGASLIPLVPGVPIRAQLWARRTGDSWGRMYVWYFFNGDPRGSDTLIAVNSDDWQLWRADWLTDPTSAANEMYVHLVISSGATADEATFYWRNAQLYYLIPEGTELSAWYPHEPPTFGTHTVKTFELEQPATLWAARNCARRYWQSFRRGVGKGTIEARGVLFDVRGREVPVSRIRGGWWASIVNDPRCRSPLYVSSVECSPEGLEATLGIGGELPPWSDRRRARERPRFGRYADWRGFAPHARRRR